MGGFRLGSILGFEIRIDGSWFIIFFLLFWSLGAGVFPQSQPGLSTGAHYLMGLVTTLLFFASLLAHELSHSVVARAKGIPVDGITLFIFGGMAHTRMEAEDPMDELSIAGVGPLASLVIAGAFGVLAWGGSRLAWPEALVGPATYLAWINVVLAVFNLLPGFPLDGGRLFRAGAWKITGDLTRATYWASMGGQILGWLLIGLGALQLLYQCYPVADKGGRGVLGLVTLNQVKEAGEEMWDRTTVEEVMTPRSEVEVAPEEPMTRVIERLRDGLRRVLVVRDDRLLGVISAGDVTRWVQLEENLKGVRAGLPQAPRR